MEIQLQLGSGDSRAHHLTVFTVGQRKDRPVATTRAR